MKGNAKVNTNIFGFRSRYHPLQSFELGKKLKKIYSIV